jgi:ABC-2 type transport system permease protein
MHGGKVIWAVDFVEANMDSLRYATSTLAMPLDLNLQEILFSYGARVNTNLVLNRNAMEIGTAEGVLKPWDFFPLALPTKGNPITQNMNSLSTSFVSSIDTVGSSSIRKTVLLKTDLNTRIMPTPALVDLVDIIYRGPNPALYNRLPQPIAVLLEGSFTSIFENRIIDPRIMNNKELFDIQFHSLPTSQLVISDGDLLKNQVMETADGLMPYPLGYDRFSKRTYDNKKFMLNAVNYMMGDDALIQLRNKQYKIRLLNKERISNEKLKWQILNTSIPILLIIVMGLIINIVKRRRYARPIN